MNTSKCFKYWLMCERIHTVRSKVKYKGPKFEVKSWKTYHILADLDHDRTQPMQLKDVINTAGVIGIVICVQHSW